MPEPEKIPLAEAAARGLLPCTVCGAKGADVRKVDGKEHFLCPACARRGRAWTWLLAGLALSGVLLGGYLLVRPKPPSAPASAQPPPADPDAWMKETRALMRMHKWREARDRIALMLEPLPKQPLLNVMMGECLMGLRHFDAAIPCFTTAMQEDPEARKAASVYLGGSYQAVGRSSQALPFLEQPSPIEPLEESRRQSLADCYLDLERYEDALQQLPVDPKDEGSLWIRHRALYGLGRRDEAMKLAAGRPTFLAAILREEGDFDGARAALDKAPPSTRVTRARLALALEAGDLAALDAGAKELAAASADPQVRAEALFLSAVGHLVGGRADAARASAWEFLHKTDKDFSPIRLERMMMRHLAGELKEADLDAEAKLLSRFRANDVYWYLAVATGDRAWAQKAASATPGRNYPYHAIQRLLKK